MADTVLSGAKATVGFDTAKADVRGAVEDFLQRVFADVPATEVANAARERTAEGAGCAAAQELGIGRAARGEDCGHDGAREDIAYVHDLLPMPRTIRGLHQQVRTCARFYSRWPG